MADLAAAKRSGDWILVWVGDQPHLAQWEDGVWATNETSAHGFAIGFSDELVTAWAPLPPRRATTVVANLGHSISTNPPR